MSPTTGRKNEYQRRVSPIVRSGGRSSDIHMPMINRKKITKPATVNRVGINRLLLLKAATAAIVHKITDSDEKYMK